MSVRIVQGTIEYYMTELQDALSEQLGTDASLGEIEEALFGERWFENIYTRLFEIREEERRNNE